MGTKRSMFDPSTQCGNNAARCRVIQERLSSVIHRRKSSGQEILAAVDVIRCDLAGTCLIGKSSICAHVLYVANSD